VKWISVVLTIITCALFLIRLFSCLTERDAFGISGDIVRIAFHVVVLILLTINFIRYYKEKNKN
jgi:hypothetical protein